MSRNILEITLTSNVLSSQPARRAAAESFGICQTSMAQSCRVYDSMVLLVTFEQFGSFIARRNAYGGCNTIKELQPKVIMHPRSLRVDCTEHRIAA